MTEGPRLEVTDSLLHSQSNYYEARAPEYDDWFYRRGRYDRGEAATTRWFHEVDEVRTALASANWQDLDVLELAPGTGLWSLWLLEHGARLSVVDGSPAMLDQLRARLGGRAASVSYEIADLFAWSPGATFDRVFVGFFLSHVPRARLEQFLATVVAALRPGGVVAFVDSCREPTSTAADHVLPTQGDEVMTRRLDDGREFAIVKNFYEPDELVEVGARVGLTVQAAVTPTYFLYGTGTRS